MNRRRFVKTLTTAGLTLPFAQAAQAAGLERNYKLTILHTNDVHSRIDPFPANSKYPNQGGFARRAEIIEQIRQQEENVVLLDSGDIFQGTPFFNVYGGELEFKLMSLMRYDAATLGNHDFDAGIDGLLRQLPHAKFPFVNANYDFSASGLSGKIKPYKVLDRNGLRIGITGVGIALEGLVPDNLFKGVVYHDPVDRVNEIAQHLKNQEACDMVICLSHLGYRYQGPKIDDYKLAQQSENIDVILGGHTHTFLEKPTLVETKRGNHVIINQVGWAGVMLGKIDIDFDRQKRPKKMRNLSVNIS